MNIIHNLDDQKFKEPVLKKVKRNPALIPKRNQPSVYERLKSKDEPPPPVFTKYHDNQQSYKQQQRSHDHRFVQNYNRYPVESRDSRDTDGRNIQRRNTNTGTNVYPNVHHQPSAPVPVPIPIAVVPAKVQQQPQPQNEIFPRRENEFWSTLMFHEPEKSQNATLSNLNFAVTFVWIAGCRLNKWPFENLKTESVMNSSLTKIRCTWKKGFNEVTKYMSEIRMGGKKAHLAHHWMLCEVHPYSTNDVVSYGDFCNYYKDMRRVSAAMCPAVKHEHLLFYLCPPDEEIISAQHMKEIFGVETPKGLLWALIFIKNLTENDRHQSSTTVVSSVVVGGGGQVSKDPRKKLKRKSKSKEKERLARRKSNVEEEEDLLKMLGVAEDTMKASTRDIGVNRVLDDDDHGKAQRLSPIVIHSQPVDK